MNAWNATFALFDSLRHPCSPCQPPPPSVRECPRSSHRLDLPLLLSSDLFSSLLSLSEASLPRRCHSFVTRVHSGPARSRTPPHERRSTTIHSKERSAVSRDKITVAVAKSIARETPLCCRFGGWLTCCRFTACFAPHQPRVAPLGLVGSWTSKDVNLTRPCGLFSSLYTS